MRISRNKSKATMIAIALLMASIALLNAPVSSAQAQLAPNQPTSGPVPSGVTPEFTVSTTAYLSVRPNPIGMD